MFKNLINALKNSDDDLVEEIINELRIKQGNKKEEIPTSPNPL